MANTATIKNSKDIYINDIFVYTCPTAAKATAFLDVLQNILFSSSPTFNILDLDFITPTIYDNSYGVCCSLTREGYGTTYFFNNLHPPVTRNLYSSSIIKLYAFDYTVTAPWYEALKLANAIRYATKLNYNSVREISPSVLVKLAVPTNTGSTVNKIISSSCSVQFYGHPDQGSQEGATSYSSSLGYYVENIAGPCTANADVLHPCDMTAAITSSNNWSTLYMNKYVKVTNGSNSIVVRITDVAPAGKGIELTWRAYQELGSPSTAKIELMN